MKLFTLLLFISLPLFAEVPITNLPSYTGSQVGTLDVVPFVNQATNTTGKLQLSQIFSIPSLQSPTFTGLLTVPTGSFNSVTTPTATFINVNLNVPTRSFINCGSVSGAVGCYPLIINQKVQYVPYF